MITSIELVGYATDSEAEKLWNTIQRVTNGLPITTAWHDPATAEGATISKKYGITLKDGGYTIGAIFRTGTKTTVTYLSAEKVRRALTELSVSILFGD